MSEENVERLRAAYETFGGEGLAWNLLVRLRGRAKMSGGVPIEETFAHLFKFRGERIALWEAYSDRDAALAAAGVRE